jgi:hypothetical protein
MIDLRANVMSPLNVCSSMRALPDPRVKLKRLLPSRALWPSGSWIGKSALAQVDEVTPGDRVVSTGDGGLYPPDILIGQVVPDRDGRLRLRPAADHQRLDFVRVLRRMSLEVIEGPGEMIGPLLVATPEVVQ